MPAGKWPWTTAVEYELGRNVCGEIVYDVLVADPFSPTGYSSQDLVVMGTDPTTGEPTLVLKPTVEHPVQTYDMILVGTLPNGVSTAEPFRVTVLDCVVQDFYWIDGTERPPMENIWYKDSLAFDIADLRGSLI